MSFPPSPIAPPQVVPPEAGVNRTCPPPLPLHIQQLLHLSFPPPISAHSSRLSSLSRVTPLDTHLPRPSGHSKPPRVRPSLPSAPLPPSGTCIREGRMKGKWDTQWLSIFPSCEFNKTEYLYVSEKCWRNWRKNKFASCLIIFKWSLLQFLLTKETWKWPYWNMHILSLRRLLWVINFLINILNSGRGIVCMIIIQNKDLPSLATLSHFLSLRSPHRGSTYRRSSSRSNSKSLKSKSSRSYSRSSSRSRSRSRSLSRSRYFQLFFSVLLISFVWFSSIFFFFNQRNLSFKILHLLLSYLKSTHLQCIY